MGKKLTFTSLFFKLREPSSSSSSTTTTNVSSPSSSSSSSSTISSSTSTWPWASCKHPKTSSFRGGRGHDDTMFKTVNSVYFDYSNESCFTNTSEDLLSESFSTVSEDSNGDSSLEMVIKGLRSDRLFFEPCTTTSLLIMDQDTTSASITNPPPPFDDLPFKESVAMAMDSEDPYRDFRESMEEMVRAHGIKTWDSLEDLLVWYLKVNGKKTHGFILGAFVDLLVSLASSSSFSPSPSCSYSSSSSSSSSSLSFEIHEVLDDDDEQDV
ncbi:Ovate protein family C-terminal protein [Dioscorea alata]|uniref:Ovate protein family C-terminal protein n=1 Tax=Dioscorea alata TaxID=55571 RepID=A0ACB7VZZ9_DIOAL|nr:Ovate protein family C-terminal protein [Dioscorea alata]